MALFQKKNKKWGFFQTIEKALYHLGFLKKETFFQRHAINFLNIAQFLGVVNDNVFKYLIVFLFIDLKGIAASPIILTWVGVVYVLPFLFFSSRAGILADRFSKQQMIIVLKFTEIIIIALGIVAFIFKSEWASYTLLFLLSMQSAFFGPPKYSIIAELVKEEHIPKANGLITSFTYLGVIVGTFLASFLTQVTGKNFPLSAGVCLSLAGIGFLSSLFIPKTAPKPLQKEVHRFFLYQIYKTLRNASRTPYLLVAILSSASFLFIGAYFQLNIIPYAIKSMGYTEVAGGYLFLLTAVGIACGAFLAGKISHKRPEIGIACISGVFLSILITFLGILYRFHVLVFCALFVLGIFGGIFIVPFDSFIQRHASKQRRGQVIAATNFLSFCGVLIAPILLYVFSETLQLSAKGGFIVTGIIILSVMLSIISRLSNYFFHALARILVKPLYKLEAHNFPFEAHLPVILIWEKLERVNIALLATLHPQLCFYLPRSRKRYSDILLKLFSSIHFLYSTDPKQKSLKAFVQTAKKTKHSTPYLLFPYPGFFEEKSSKKQIQELKKVQNFDVFSVTVQKISREEQVDRKFFKRVHVTFDFHKQS